MIPIQELLSRIRWDPKFGDADFRLGYYDRVADQVLQVPLRQVWFEPDDHFDFYLLDQDGEEHRIPLHRVRDVYRNGQLIWHREH